MPVVAKHVVTLRTAFQEKAKRMEDVQQKWFPPLPEETNTAFTNNVHYNPKDVDTDIICFREYAFSIMLDFAFAHGEFLSHPHASCSFLVVHIEHTLISYLP